MSDSDRSSEMPGRQGATTSATAQRHSSPRGWNAGLLKTLWSRKPRHTGAHAGPGGNPSPGRAGSSIWMLFILGILLCVPIGGIILGYLTRPAAGTASIAAGGVSSDASSDNSGKIPKPVPGKPLSASQSPPPTTTLPTPSPIAPLSPPQVSPPPRPVAPMSTPTPSFPTPAPPPLASAPANPGFAAVTYPARHDKHFGDVCMGQLTLNSTELVFSCPGDSDGGIQVAINQIESLDENGIRLTSGKKYHFTIPGMDKNSERALFADWLRRVR